MIMRRFGSSRLSIAIKSEHADESSDVTITLRINGSKIVKFFIATRYSSGERQRERRQHE